MGPVADANRMLGGGQPPDRPAERHFASDRRPAERHLASDRPLALDLTLARLAHGPGDPTFRRGTLRSDPGDYRDPSGHPDPAFHHDHDGGAIEIWRTSRFPSGPVTYRLVQTGPREVVGQAWGPGAAQMLVALPDLVGERDDATAFAPPPQLLDAHRRSPGLRIPRTGRVMEALVPAILEQKVQTDSAHRAWAWLLHRYGEPAPGPAPSGMRVVPDAETWAAIPSWDFHRAGVEPRQARTIVAAARVARRMEECLHLGPAAAHARMQAVPGIGAWTTAEVACRALGDADAVPVGDFHLAKAVGWALAGERADDEQMLRLLAPYAPHRYRVIRLLEISGLGRAPRRGPRLAIQDHRRN